MSSLKGQNDKDKLSSNDKKIFDGIPDSERSLVDGGCLKPKKDFSPRRANATGIEHTIDNRKNSQNSGITFTRDRPSHYCSGRGGRGESGASTIDIVVGYQSSFDKSKLPPLLHPHDEHVVDPDFFADAARIYISQKTDVDFNFGLSPGTKGSPGIEGEKRPSSAIAIKADSVRVIARENIKLITGTDVFNSQGGKVISPGGVDLIAGNEVGEQQPIPKGDNLAAALERIVTHLDQVTGIVQAFLTHQMNYNEVLADHFHLSPFWGIETEELFEPWFTGVQEGTNLQTQCQRSCSNKKADLKSMMETYLKESGENYINSKFHSVN